MLEVTIRSSRVFVGERFSLSFQRTQRVTQDLHAAPAPVSWGALPVHTVSSHPEHFPQLKGVENGFFIPVGDEEAVWLGFGGDAWPPRAVKVGVGGRNAVSGAHWGAGLNSHPQDYLVCPPQPSLEGVRTEAGAARQIVRSGGADIGAPEANLIRVLVYDPKGGRFPEARPARAAGTGGVLHSHPFEQDAAASLTLGERIEREIRPDPYGPDAWEAAGGVTLSVYMLGHEEYRKVTGREPPPRPAPSDLYGGHRLP